MTCLLPLSLCTTTFLARASIIITKCSPYRNSGCLWRKTSGHPGFKSIGSEFVQTRLQAHCYSTRKGRKGRKSASMHLKVEPDSEMEQEKDAFFVVRKGDMVGVYKNLNECQAQVGSSICDPPVSVYKGFSLPKSTEEYLATHGLKNSLYTIRGVDLKEDLFGMLVPCPFKDPATSRSEMLDTDASMKRLQEDLGPKEGHSLEPLELEDPLRKHQKLDHSSTFKATASDIQTCILEFDGASKGNPGQAGAGAILRSNDGSLICRLREGLGTATCNAAEYRAIILGMRYALEKGFRSIRVQGDSKLVCMQIQGLWKVKNENMSNLHKEAKKLEKKFLSFQISHVLRKWNAEADAQANLAVSLADGQIEEEPGNLFVV